MKDKLPIFVFIIGILVLYFISKKPIEKYEIVTDIPCNNCRIWNHVDAKTKCDRSCQKTDLDNPSMFSGKWKTNLNKLQDSVCNCVRNGEIKQNYIGCPIGTPDCFIWNDSDAKTICPKICTEYSSKNAQWTGNWKSTSMESSACECKYSV